MVEITANTIWPPISSDWRWLTKKQKYLDKCMLIRWYHLGYRANFYF